MRVDQAVSKIEALPLSLTLRISARSSIEDFASESKAKAAAVEKELAKLKRDVAISTKDLKKSEQELVSSHVPLLLLVCACAPSSAASCVSCCVHSQKQAELESQQAGEEYKQLVDDMAQRDKRIEVRVYINPSLALLWSWLIVGGADPCRCLRDPQSAQQEMAKLETVVAKCKAAYDKAEAALNAEKERISAADKR
jgi:hypothetical protein